jgi:FkbH-like protein
MNNSCTHSGCRPNPDHEQGSRVLLKLDRGRGDWVSTGIRRPGRRLAAVLRRDRHGLALKLLENVAGWEKYARDIKEHQSNFEEYVKLQFYVFVDYLARYFATGDDTYKQLYIGEKLKQFCDAALSPEEDDANRRRIMEADIRVLCGHVASQLGAQDAQVLEALLRDVERVVSERGRKQLDLLFFGDCLYLDVRGFLAPAALGEGISHRAAFVTTKNPAEQRNALRRMAGQRFDLIFYSPFTYEYSLDLVRFHDWRQAAADRASISAAAGAVMDEVERNLDLLATLFDGPTYVHNAVNVRRHDSTASELVKTALTRRSRRLARAEVNRRLAEAVAARRRGDGNLILFDEVELLDHHGELALGRTIYATPIQHPAALSRIVAAKYHDLLVTHADLVGKKVIVCDLDNTLWKGEIGEGTVEHFVEAQRVLKELRRKGVLLTVNSKNDARNVHWDGALLQKDDFVQLQINWDSKVSNMRRLQEALNLKFKDFVFVDDRADQRALVAQAIPEIHVLDATNSAVWKRLALWAAALPDDPESDRTRQYREREQREGFLTSASAVEEDQAALFAKLGIRIEVRAAGSSELKRVTELINRTNQFNLAGSRTSLKELRAWHDSPGKCVVVVEASDRFGAMGIVSAALVDVSELEIRIPVFVLSCRVFGYGIENAVLSAIKGIARSRAARCIRGAYRETAHNEPCRKMYAENGFSWGGDSWVLTRDAFEHGTSCADPTWLEITDRLSHTALLGSA